MYIIIYGVIKDNDNDMSLEGPYFYGNNENFEIAENLAREITNSNTKDAIIAKVCDTKDTVLETMNKVSDGWFKKLRMRTMDTNRILKRDQDNVSCPFVNVHFSEFLQNNFN